MNYEELVELVIYHSHLYYDNSAPEITDAEFDALYDQLVALEKAQGWAVWNSPTLRVGGTPGKVQHAKKLYSLNKVYNKDDVDPAFDIQTPKIDGACLAIYYTNGRLERMVTRGNGEFGEDVTRFKEVLLGIPLTTDTDELIVVGECVTMNKDVKNYRNYVSGALGLDSVNEFENRQIAFIAHDELTLQKSYTDRMKFIAQQEDFTTVLSIESNQFPTDGVVYRINDWRACQDLGYTSKHPRFAVALKPRGVNVASTVLQSVIWVVGRTGTVNPVGIVSPVELDDATVSRVTLHNFGFIESHRLGLGDIIEIERAGGVIPKFIRVLQERSYNQKIEQKHAELAIGLATRRDGPRLIVADKSQASTSKFLEYFVKTMEIKGLGPASITKMGLSHPVDLYTEKNWSSLGANGVKVADEVERSKTKPYYVVLAALGIPGVGKSVARLIADHIPRFDRLREVESVHIPGVGPKTIENILAWLDVNEDWVATLPLQLEQNQSISTAGDSNSFKKVCITGKLDMSRTELTELLEEFGFQVTSTVTKDCYALISAETNSDSSKMKTAKKNNIKIVDYWAHKKEILKGQV